MIKIYNKYLVAEIFQFIANRGLDVICVIRQLNRNYREFADGGRLLIEREQPKKYDILLLEINISVDRRILNALRHISILRVDCIQTLMFLCGLLCQNITINIGALHCDLQDQQTKGIVIQFINNGGYVRNLHNTCQDPNADQLINLQDLPGNFISLCRNGNITGYVAVNMRDVPTIQYYYYEQHKGKHKFDSRYARNSNRIYRVNSITGQHQYLTTI